MSRRGKCRCGTILKFRRGPTGYKMRCPACGAVVRLRVEPDSTPSRTVSCSCGEHVQVTGTEPTVCPRCHRTLSTPLKRQAPTQDKKVLPTEVLDAYEANK